MLDQDPQVTPLHGWPSPHMPLVPPPSFPKAPITASASPWYLESAIRPAPRCGSMFCPCLENPSTCILQRCLSSNCPPSCILPSCPLLAHSHVENKPSYSHLKTGDSLAVQWLRVHAFTAMGLGSIPDQGTKIPSALQLMAQKEKNQTSYIPFQLSLLTAKLPEVAAYAHFPILLTPSMKTALTGDSKELCFLEEENTVSDFLNFFQLPCLEIEPGPLAMEARNPNH